MRFRRTELETNKITCTEHNAIRKGSAQSGLNGAVRVGLPLWRPDLYQLCTRHVVTFSCWLHELGNMRDSFPYKVIFVKWCIFDLRCCENEEPNWSRHAIPFHDLLKFKFPECIITDFNSVNLTMPTSFFTVQCILRWIWIEVTVESKYLGGYII